LHCSPIRVSYGTPYKIVGFFKVCFVLVAKVEH
jgi:hypothetical protein